MTKNLQKETKRRRLDVKWIIGGITVPLIVAVVGYLSTREPKLKVPLLKSGYDFIQKASEAHWSNGTKTLEFPGDRGDRDGFVYFGSFDSVPLENGVKTRSFLETHPRWVSHGIIEGKYGPFKIGNNLQIRCEVGFLLGATGTDGVEFRVEFEDENSFERVTLGKKVAIFDGRLDELVIDLTSIAREKGYIILHVDALDSSGRDWAVWNVAMVIR